MHASSIELSAMHLRHLLLPCLDPDLTRRFYRDALQLPLHGNTLRIGCTTLDCVQAQHPVGIWPSTSPLRAWRPPRNGSLRAARCLPTRRASNVLRWPGCGNRGRCISPAPMALCWS
ncbi:hypothetical protein CFBP498_03800 [Xanthomonas hortorum pv. vitians]|uniref:Glyoxalase-like domain-containing protein n=3 Tax=Xanthomonas hortorum TaxID=56454 RepID=A0A6V7BV61_9XANT|nr:hypothetical protein XHV734_0402 [Xanthomonas hortorum pv. vitians]CAD0302316.1 hypothetical protein CFBP8129_03680 [Xanthomonas hortorum pv. gardneri]CAD0305771.1 hypothetical protein CFBP7900_04090 [Xanthomonas hortorum pv. carotae]CAD0302321.1 hypothetical protein CFBP8129_03680 [Xanthomonas hortorum pv. gardneri]CAD0302499.1 hypothetical protein CFBP498_03800 [Xanthomonas hortorum pv. vitians]